MTSTTDPSPTTAAESPDRRWIIGIAATVAVFAVAAMAWFYDGFGTEETLVLSLDAEDPAASCLALDPSILAGMSPSFAGTVRSVEGETVLLDVDRWYAGDEADAVELQAPAGLEALIGGIAFEIGQHYLISATDGTVNYCGFSGPVSPQLQAAYDAAFGS